MFGFPYQCEFCCEAPICDVGTRDFSDKVLVDILSSADKSGVLKKKKRSLSSTNKCSMAMNQKSHVDSFFIVENFRR